MLAKINAPMNVMLIGPEQSGKTVLLRRCLEKSEPFDFNKYEYKSTVTDSVMTVVDGIKLWDSAGQKRFDSLNVTFYRQIDKFLLCVDLTKLNDNYTYNRIKEYCEEISIHRAPTPVTFILVGTKLDEVKDKKNIQSQLQTFQKKLVEELQTKHQRKPQKEPQEGYSFSFDGCFMVSAKNNENVKELFATVSSKSVSKIINNKIDQLEAELKEQQQLVQIEGKTTAALTGEANPQRVNINLLVASTNEITEKLNNYYLKVKGKVNKEVELKALNDIKREAEEYQANILQLTGNQRLAIYTLGFVGAVLGAVAGAIVGFMIGNVVGAAAGAIIGAGVGAVVLGSVAGTIAITGSRWSFFNANKEARPVERAAYEYGQAVRECVREETKQVMQAGV